MNALRKTGAAIFIMVPRDGIQWDLFYYSRLQRFAKLNDRRFYRLIWPEKRMH
jgi:hypothetical protein